MDCYTVPSTVYSQNSDCHERLLGTWSLMQLEQTVQAVVTVDCTVYSYSGVKNSTSDRISEMQEAHQCSCLTWGCCTCVMQINSLHITYMPSLCDQLAVSFTYVLGRQCKSWTMPVFSTKHYFDILDATADHLNLILGLLLYTKFFSIFACKFNMSCSHNVLQMDKN